MNYKANCVYRWVTGRHFASASASLAATAGTSIIVAVILVSNIFNSESQLGHSMEKRKDLQTILKENFNLKQYRYCGSKYRTFWHNLDPDPTVQLKI